MRKGRVLGLLAGVIASASFAAGPEIRIDHAHMQIGDDAKEKLIYRIPPSSSLVIDLTGYRFALWPAEEPPPDAITVVISDEEQYHAELRPGVTRVTLSAKTLVPRAGGKPFTGFPNGRRTILAIGKRRFEAAKGEDVLRVHWMGLVDVGEKPGA